VSSFTERHIVRLFTVRRSASVPTEWASERSRRRSLAQLLLSALLASSAPLATRRCALTDPATFIRRIVNHGRAKLRLTSPWHANTRSCYCQELMLVFIYRVMHTWRNTLPPPSITCYSSHFIIHLARSSWNIHSSSLIITVRHITNDFLFIFKYFTIIIHLHAFCRSELQVLVIGSFSVTKWCTL